MLCYAVLCYAMLCYAMLCYAMLCYAMLCYAMLCYAMLCYAVLCIAMLYYAMLCIAMLCCAVLCCQRDAFCDMALTNPVRWTYPTNQAKQQSALPRNNQAGDHELCKSLINLSNHHAHMQLCCTYATEWFMHGWKQLHLWQFAVCGRCTEPHLTCLAPHLTCSMA